MKRFKGFLAGLLTVLALVAMLALWIWLPWQAVLGLAVAIALWLMLTRGGRLALAAAGIGIAGLPQRWGASLVIGSDCRVVCAGGDVAIVEGSSPLYARQRRHRDPAAGRLPGRNQLGDQP